jgi:hypothetical protein
MDWTAILNYIIAASSILLYFVAEKRVEHSGLLVSIVLCAYLVTRGVIWRKILPPAIVSMQIALTVNVLPINLPPPLNRHSACIILFLILVSFLLAPEKKKTHIIAQTPASAAAPKTMPAPAPAPAPAPSSATATEPEPYDPIDESVNIIQTRIAQRKQITDRLNARLARLDATGR